MPSGRKSRLHRALAGAVKRLDAKGIPYMVIGGMALLARGYARLTRDVDITIKEEPGSARRLLAALGPDFRPIPERPVAFALRNYVLPTEGPGGTQVDFLFCGTGFERAAVGRATFESIGGVRARVCTAEDLIVLKILGGRPHDLEDVRNVVRASGRSLDRKRLDGTIAALAAVLDRPEIDWFWKSTGRRGRGKRP